MPNIKPDLPPKDAATPCGLIAKSLFNDTYQIRYSATNDFTTPGKSEILTIDENNIAWASDMEYKFKNYKDSDSGMDGKTW